MSAAPSSPAAISTEPAPSAPPRPAHGSKRAKKHARSTNVTEADDSPAHKQPRITQGQAKPATASSRAADVRAPLAPQCARLSFFPAGRTSRCPCMLHRSARILVIGDGDLSYSVGLVRHLCSARHAQLEQSHCRADQSALADDGDVCDHFLSDDEARQFYDGIPTPSDESNFVSKPASLQITCTTYEDATALHERYPQSAANAALLTSWGVRVVHGVDARKLETYGDKLEPLASATAVSGAMQASAVATADASSTHSNSSLLSDGSSQRHPRRCTFDHVLFHFPHVGGKSRIHLNRALLSDFLCSVRSVLTPANESSSIPESTADHASRSHACRRGGCVHVSLLRGQGGTPLDPTHRPRYADHWQLLECGSRAGMLLSHVFPFHPPLYPGYSNTGFRSRDEEFSSRRGTSITHILTVQSEDDDKPRQDGIVAPVVCPADVDVPALPPDTRMLLQRNLCSTENHPLQRVHSCLADASTVLHATAAGFCRLPFQEYPSIALPEAGRLSALESIGASDSSFVRVELELPSQHEVNSLQWNLEPLVSVAADMESQVSLPIAAEVVLKMKAATPSASASSVADSIPDDAALVVPFMRDGLPLLHLLRVTQRFVALSTDQLVDDASLHAAMLSDARNAAAASLRTLFGPDVQSTVRSRGMSSDEAVSVSSSVDTRQLDVALRHSSGVWHVVAEGWTYVQTEQRASWTLRWSLDKLAMLRFNVSDVRWLWSRDERFLAQFRTATPSTVGAATSPVEPVDRRWRPFVPFALYTLAFVRDHSFWLNPVAPVAREGPRADTPAVTAASTDAARPLLDGDTFMRAYMRAVSEVVRPSRCCSVCVTDQFTHPVRGAALRVRCIFHCADGVISPEQILRMQKELHDRIVSETGVEMR